MWVSGVVTGLRRGPCFTTWELVEYGEDAARVRAVLSVGAFPRELAEITSVLDGAGLELADGLEVTLWGGLDPNPGFGRLRLLAPSVDPDLNRPGNRGGSGYWVPTRFWSVC